MISIPLWKRELKANAAILFLFLGLVTMYGGIITAMYDPESGDMLHMMAESMPELFAAFGMSSSGTNLMEFLTNYLYGFILLVIPFLGIVILTHRLVVRYIDRGSMAYLLVSGNSRQKIIFTQALFLICFIAVICIYVTCFLWICALLLHQESLPMQPLLMLNFGLFALLLAFSGIVFLSAVSFNETKWALGIGVGIGIFFLLVQMLSQVGNSMEFLKYLTITTLFDTTAIIQETGTPLVGIFALLAIAILCYGIAIQYFRKRDLPL